MTDEQQQEEVAYLVERVGVTADEAHRMMREDDLWLVELALRLEVPDEEAIEQWRIADDALEALVHVANNIGLGTMVAIMDAKYRVGVALEWTRERVRRASLQEEE
jgi:hypothetical protein